NVSAITQLTPAALLAMGACYLEEPQPKFLSATMMSPLCTLCTKSLSMYSIQCVARSAGSEEFRYLAGIITSVSTLSPYLNTLPFACIVLFLLIIPVLPVRKSFRSLRWPQPPPGSPDKLLNPHVPYVLRSYGWLWRYISLLQQGF